MKGERWGTQKEGSPARLQRLEAGGKIMLPPSALHKLAQLEIAYPMLFELTNSVNGRK